MAFHVGRLDYTVAATGSPEPCSFTREEQDDEDDITRKIRKKGCIDDGMA